MSAVPPFDNYVTVNGLKLHYLDWGNEGKQDMLLLHGLSGHAHFWDTFARSMKDKYSILALDQRGHGDSDWSKAGYSTDQFVSDIVGFVEQLALDKFILVGLSLGGRNAMAYAADYSHKLDKLVIVDMGPALRTEGLATMLATQTVFDSEEQALAQALARFPRYSREFAWNRMYYATRRRDDGKLELKQDHIGHARARQEMFGAPLWEQIKRITCPTLLVRGTTSNVLDRDVALQMEQAIPNCKLVEVDSGHSIPGENPAGFEKVVRDFLEV